jgi:hypothetical protein
MARGGCSKLATHSQHKMHLHGGKKNGEAFRAPRCTDCEASSGLTPVGSANVTHQCQCQRHHTAPNLVPNHEHSFTSRDDGATTANVRRHQESASASQHVSAMKAKEL